MIGNQQLFLKKEKFQLITLYWNLLKTALWVNKRLLLIFVFDFNFIITYDQNTLMGWANQVLLYMLTDERETQKGLHFIEDHILKGRIWTIFCILPKMTKPECQCLQMVEFIFSHSENAEEKIKTKRQLI